MGNMRFLKVIGATAVCRLVTMDCSDSACTGRRDTLMDPGDGPFPGDDVPIACCDPNMPGLQSCGTMCVLGNADCLPADGCARRRRGVLSDDFDDLDEDINLTEGADWC